jgi:hypothetical protein
MRLFYTPIHCPEVDTQINWWTQIVKLSEFNQMPEIVIMAEII